MPPITRLCADNPPTSLTTLEKFLQASSGGPLAGTVSPVIRLITLGLTFTVTKSPSPPFRPQPFSLHRHISAFGATQCLFPQPDGESFSNQQRVGDALRRTHGRHE